jgi:voltage-gated potassium channel
VNATLRSRILNRLWVLVGLVIVGTLGYMVIERWTFIDALFMTVTTLTTVGYGEVHPLDTGGRIYTMILLLFGVGFLFYILVAAAELLVEANPGAFFNRRRMKEKISKLNGHQIVCGFGRTGQEVARLFDHYKVPFVVIEDQIGRAKQAESLGFLAMQGDATTDEALLEAQVKRAIGVVCTLPDDAANTFITLSAKGLNENIMVVCRAANPGSEAKMMRAGAHSVISPYIICGRRMATAVTHPLVLEFLDVAMHSPSYDLRLEQVLIASDSTLIGLTLKDANLKQKSGVMVLAVNQGGKLVTNPPPEYTFQSGDELIVLGADEELKKVRQLAEPGRKD